MIALLGTPPSIHSASSSQVAPYQAGAYQVTRSQVARPPFAHKIAVIGDDDERLLGSRPIARRGLGAIADIYLGRALRIWFPHPGSLATTGTPVCFPDIVVTAAHIYANVGDGTAEPLGLRISVPDLNRPGKFRDTLTVKDFHASTRGRQFDRNQLPVVRDDFLVLSLNKPIPDDVVPLGLLPFADIKDLKMPLRCQLATVNAAYHADLGVLRDPPGDRIVPIWQPGIRPGSVRHRGRLPLVTISSTMSEKEHGGARYGEWYTDPLVAFPEHDTHDTASGSAIVCPGDNHSKIKTRDHLAGLMVGQMFYDPIPSNGTVQPDGVGPASVGSDRTNRPVAINVATYNLAAIYSAIAALKNITVESLHERCDRHIDRALIHH